MSTLYLVATPIGNLKDITLRAIEILSQVNYIACEDTRRMGTLLKHFLVKPPKLLSYYEHNEEERIPQIVQLLKEGGDVALVSDSGTPTISDPGFKLVRACILAGVSVVSIPGPTSLVSALVVSGLPTDKFLFLGYLPRKLGHRQQLLKDCTLLPFSCTLIVFEAPHRLVNTLAQCLNIFGDRDVAICRELTKVHEEIRRERISESLSYFKTTTPRGEFVILLHL